MSQTGADNIWTTIIAIYAAIVATGGLAWNIYAGWRDAARLKVGIGWGSAYFGTERKGPYYVLDAANVGRRPVTINMFGFVVAPKKDQKQNLIGIMPDLSLNHLPHELTEGRSVSLFIVPGPIQATTRADLKAPPKSAFAKDQIGRIHKCRINQKMRDELWGSTAYRPMWKLWEQGWWPM